LSNEKEAFGESFVEFVEEEEVAGSGGREAEEEEEESKVDEVGIVEELLTSLS